MSRLRLPLRLARREVRRRPGRTALVALLVAIPVAGMAIAVTLIRTDNLSLQEEWSRQHGQAEAVGYAQDVSAAGLLPAGARPVEVRSTFVRLKDDEGRRASAELSDLPLHDAITAGIHDVVSGRAASKAGEVVLSTSLADHLHVDVGDDLVLERPALTARVVGKVEPAACLSCDHLLLAPGELTQPMSAYELSTSLLIDLPASTPVEQLLAMEQASLGNVEVRDLPSPYERSEGGEAVRWSLVIGALALTVVGIVISAAFAVGARRQLVTIGQLSASGASPATVRTALVLQGTVTGVVGSVAGLALAAVLLAAGQPLAERVLDARIDGYTVRPVEVVAIALIGTVAATLAALIPGRTAARIPTLAALAGRRPLAPVSRRLVVWGFASMLGGLSLLFMAVIGSQSGSSGDMWALVAIVGGVAELLGACALAPAIVSRLEPLATHLRGSLRLGARSLARNRARTGAVVSAVAAAGALAVGAGGLLLGNVASQAEDVRVPDDVVVVQRFDETGRDSIGDLPDQVGRWLADILPGAEEVPVRGAGAGEIDPQTGQGFWTVTRPDELPMPGSPPFDSPTWDRAIIADGPVLEAIRADDEVRAGLEDTGVVVLTSRNTGFEFDGAVTVGLPDGRTTDGVAVPHRYTLGYVTNILITAETAEELDLPTTQIAMAFDAPDALTAAQRGALDDLQYDIQEEQLAGTAESAPYVSLQWDYADGGPTPFQLELILSGVALVFSLFVVGVSLALAAAESKDERDVLTIAGAPPGALARSAGARAWLLAVIGAAMAVPVGFLPVVVFGWASDRDRSGFGSFPLVFPTRTVLLLVVAVPAIVALVSWTSSATAQRLRPVRVSTATFE